MGIWRADLPYLQKSIKSVLAATNEQLSILRIRNTLKHRERQSSKNGGIMQSNTNKAKMMILSWLQSTRRLASLGPNPLQTPLFLHCLLFARQTICLILMESGAINVLIAAIELARRVKIVVHLCALQSEYIVPSIDYCSNV